LPKPVAMARSGFRFLALLRDAPSAAALRRPGDHCRPVRAIKS